MTVGEPSEAETPEQPPRRWPKDRDFALEDGVSVSCENCALRWRIHRDLAGFRMACECGAWISVPTTAPIHPPRDESHVSVGRSSPELRDLPKFQAVPPPEVGRQRAITWAMVELFLVVAAFLGPSLAFALFASPEDAQRLLPVSSVCASVIVIILARVVRAGVGPNLWPYFRHIAEALVASAVFVGLAVAWMAMLDALQLLPEESNTLDFGLGFAMTLFVVAFCAGVFEEIAFRGIVQTRLTGLFGAVQGILITGTAFALAHGITLGFPLHITIGIYICSLRHRSRSLLPGMLVHIAYNGALVVMAQA